MKFILRHFLFLSALGAMALPLQAQEAPSFRFKMESPQTLSLDSSAYSALNSQSHFQRLPFLLEDGSTRVLGTQVILKLKPGTEFSLIKEVLKGFPPVQVRTLPLAGYHVLGAQDVLEAARLAEALSALEEVLQAYPEYELNLTSHGAFYTPKPNDKYWSWCWHLDNRDEDGVKKGWDMNARSAWSQTLGQGSTVAIMDTGISQEHPDLAARLENSFHYNVFTQEASPEPTTYEYGYTHGTACAGLAAASLSNETGGAGMAPGAQLAGWVMFAKERRITSLELTELFIRENEKIRIQNQSWGEEDRMVKISSLEKDAIEEAARHSNGGRGVLMVRAAGNGRTQSDNKSDMGDSNNDFKNTLDTAIMVAAVDSAGCYTSYSSPGANLLVAAPGGSSEEDPTFLSTDFLGTLGYNYAEYLPPLEDYNNYVTGTMIQGTSFSAPIISGLCALMLSANPELSVRDSRHILIQSAQYRDTSDPDTSTNGAGFRLSHNTGFGIPDAGLAVQLAKHWPPLPEQTSLTQSMPSEVDGSVPSQGYTLQISAESLAASLQIPMCITDAVFPDNSTPSLEIVDLGCVTGPITENLSGKVAFIERGESTFEEKLNYAAQAQASFVIVYDNVESSTLVNMANAYRCAIPAVFISQSSAREIQSLLEKGPVQAQLLNNPWVYTFEVDQSLLCEDVHLNLQATSSDCGTLRVTLVSPSGTRSLMHRYNFGNFQSLDWTFLSTHHFYESSYGTWRVEVSNMPQPGRGTYTTDPLVKGLSLTLHGIAITDTDHDGLRDEWEMEHLGTLQYTASEILSPSGFSNARWQVIGDDWVSQVAQLPLSADLLLPGKLRLAWPCLVPGTLYEILQYNPTSAQWELLDSVSGTSPQSEYLLPVQANTLLTIRKP